MLVQENRLLKDVSVYFDKIISKQFGFERTINTNHKKQNGVFLTNSLGAVDNILSIVEINSNIFHKKVLEPSCGQGIFILKLISNVYKVFPDEKLIHYFISKNIFFVDIQKEMVEKTISNIKSLYKYLFGIDYSGPFNCIVNDFTDKPSKNILLFDEPSENPFVSLYNSFDYVIGNPPYVTLYGRRDKKQSETQRINYLRNYNQFPESVKNGKINLVMLFIEHSLDLLKKNGKLSFIVDVSFFETAYQYTRKYLLDKTKIEELHINIKEFDVASGQVIIKLTKSSDNGAHNVKIEDHKTQNHYFIPQQNWANKDDEYKFRYNGCSIAKQIIDKMNAKTDKTLLAQFPKKNLRTCVMLLDMEEKFTFKDIEKDKPFIYPYYQGSKALSEKYGSLSFVKYFCYDKELQDAINDELKIQLERRGIKNKKRIGLGETVVYDNPKIYIRQSAKEIIASLDLNKSSANNSLYVFSLRNNSKESIDFLYFLTGWLNSDLVTYYAQQMNIIRYSQGKQPQIKIGDLGTLFIPQDKSLQERIENNVKEIYNKNSCKEFMQNEINAIIYEYYSLSDYEIKNIEKSIKDF